MLKQLLCLYLALSFTAFSFAQKEKKIIKYFFDSSQNLSGQFREDKDNEQMIRFRRFYDSTDKLNYEFIRINDSRYYYFEYDRNGKEIKNGIAKLEDHPLKVEQIPRYYDSLGNVKSYFKGSFFKFYKSGPWIEWS